jgi:hypothetical protein
MQITRNTNQTTAGPSDWFTGAVYLDQVANSTSHRNRTAGECDDDARGTGQ